MDVPLHVTLVVEQNSTTLDEQNLEMANYDVGELLSWRPKIKIGNNCLGELKPLAVNC